MSFRTVEITQPSELHIHHQHLEITQNGDTLTIPIEDINIIIAHGQNIRLSTNDISILAEHGILLMTVNQYYQPSSMTLSFVNHSRQSYTMKKQLSLPKRRRNDLWNQIVKQKISNQTKALDCLGKSGAEELYAMSGKVIRGDINRIEAQAANYYFQRYYPGINRRCEDPINSCLNYGYTVIRSAVARSAASHGFLLADGLFHRNTFNAFNLVDDLMEPFRPMVDLTAYNIVSSNIRLSKDQRRALMNVLYTECRINGEVTLVNHAIDVMVSSIRASVIGSTEEIYLPELLPLCVTGGVTE